MRAVEGSDVGGGPERHFRDASRGRPRRVGIRETPVEANFETGGGGWARLLDREEHAAPDRQEASVHAPGETVDDLGKARVPLGRQGERIRTPRCQAEADRQERIPRLRIVASARNHDIGGL